MNLLLAAAVIMTLTAAAEAASGAPQAAPRSAKDGVYTAAQANRGKAMYDEQCTECHGAMTSVTPDLAPLLSDHVFQTTWRNRSLTQLFDRIRDTMPQNKPRTLSPEQTVDLIAYILSANGLPAGEVPLAHDVETLKQIRMDAGLP
jgi:mono/diheme cytochrome c family protein